MSRWQTAALVILASAALGGCSSVEINHDYDRNVDFSRFKSFAWIQEPVTDVSGDARSARQRNSLLDKRIRGAVNDELERKGLAVDTDAPDLFVAYHTGVQDKVDVTDWGYSYRDYYWGAGGRDIDVYQYQEGTLIIDLIDANSKDLVWRGSAKGTLDENPSPEQQEQKIRDVVQQILDDYPPTGTGGN